MSWLLRRAAKDALRRATEAAAARGVFGVPTFEVAGELFWGEDATSMLLGFLADPGLFQKSAMARIERIPVGAARAIR